VGSGKTFYTYTGDLLGWVALAGFVFFIVFQAVTNRRAKKAAVIQQASAPEKE
jgi:hypothetical protein